MSNITPGSSNQHLRKRKLSRAGLGESDKIKVTGIEQSVFEIDDSDSDEPTAPKKKDDSRAIISDTESNGAGSRFSDSMGTDELAEAKTRPQPTRSKRQRRAPKPVAPVKGKGRLVMETEEDA